MKMFILCTLFAVSHAAILVGPSLLNTGASSQYRSQDIFGNYAFNYNEGHGSGATFRSESGSNGNVAGSYGLRDVDGRVRVVNYVADDDGFRADIKSNEPGVEPKDPASAAINKPVVVVAPGFHYAAPVVHYAAASTVQNAVAHGQVHVAGPYAHYAW